MIKQLLIAATAVFLSLPIYADQAGDFAKSCTEDWMKKSDSAPNKLEFKNFGEKYCGCASKMPLDTEANVQKAIIGCFTHTLLHDAMDSVEDDVGLSDAKDTDIMTACENKWSVVNAKQSADDKAMGTSFCQCAQPKLVDLLKKSDDMTDKQYYEEIATVADTCASTIDFKKLGSSDDKAGK